MRDLIERGMNRNKARSVMMEAVAAGEVCCEKFKNKLYFWEAKKKK